MWRAWVLVIVVVAGCGGGVELSAEDQELSDDFWSSLNEFERDELCEEMDTASGRADGARMIEERLNEMEDTDDLGDMSTGAEALDAFEGLVEENEARADRAVDIVKYLQEQC